MKWLCSSLAAGALSFATGAFAIDNPHALRAPSASQERVVRQVGYYQPTEAEEVAPIPEATSTHAAPVYQSEGGGCANGSCGGGNGGYYDGGYSGQVYGDAGYGYGDDGCSGDGSGDMYAEAMSSSGDWYSFFGSVSGLVMTRDHMNRIFTTFDATNVNDQILHTQEADADWVGGFEVEFGAKLGCEGGISASFWMLDDMTGEAGERSVANNLSTPIDTGFVTINGTPAGTFFDNAREHHIARRNQFYNVEVNLLHLPMCDDNSWFQASSMVGVRWFRFDETLEFCSVRGGSEFGANGGRDQAHLNVEVDNNLVGFQLGSELAVVPMCGLKLYATPVVGVYGNHIESNVGLYDGAGNNGVATPPAPGTQRNFPIAGSKDDVALLGQIDVGLSYQIGCHWRVFGGYRAVAATGVALADEQIPQFLVDTPEWEHVDSNGSLILHGAYAGLEFRW